MVDPRYLRPGLDFAKDHFFEEIGEVLKEFGKAGRFGYFSYDPRVPPVQRELNIDACIREIRDVIKTAARLLNELDLKKTEYLNQQESDTLS